MKKKYPILLILLFFIAFISVIIGVNKYKLRKDILLAERTAQLFGMSEDNYLATKRNTAWQMYDNIDVLFSSHYSLESLAAKIKELGFEKLDYFDTRVDHNFSDQPVSSITGKLWIKNGGNKTIINVTSWRLRGTDNKIVKVEYAEIGGFGDEWIYREREVGNKLIRITLHR